MTARDMRPWSVILAIFTLQTEALIVDYFQPATHLVQPLRDYALNDDERLTEAGDYDLAPESRGFGQLKILRTTFLGHRRAF